MSDRSRSIGARLLILCRVIAIVGGFFASLVISIQAFGDGNTTSGIVLGAIAIGCAVLCYRTIYCPRPIADVTHTHPPAGRTRAHPSRRQRGRWASPAGSFALEELATKIEFSKDHRSSTPPEERADVDA